MLQPRRCRVSFASYDKSPLSFVTRFVTVAWFYFHIALWLREAESGCVRAFSNHLRRTPEVSGVRHRRRRSPLQQDGGCSSRTYYYSVTAPLSSPRRVFSARSSLLNALEPFSSSSSSSWTGINGNVPTLHDDGATAEESVGTVTSELSLQDYPEQLVATDSSQTASTAAAASTPDFVDDAVPNEYSYSASDWWHNMMSVRRSSILRAIKVPVLAVSVWSTAVSVVHWALPHRFGPTVAAHMCMDAKIHSFLVSALGLLLVFRTNSAYQRFKDGRNIWERIHSLARNLSRMALLYEPELGLDRRRRVVRLLSAFPYLLHQHIQPQCDSTLACSAYGVPAHVPPSRRRGGGGLTSSSTAASCWVDRRQLPWSLFPETVMHKCLQASNRPLWVCDRLGHEFQYVPYGPNFTSRERLSLLSQVEKLTQCIGECERISFTAVPLNYARHALRSLTLWLFTLPFAVVNDLRFATGPVIGLSAWLLYGIYQIGYQIEDPFQGSLRLNTLCHAIYRDVMDGTDCYRRRATAFAKDTRQDRDAWKELEASGLPPVPSVDDSSPEGNELSP